MKTAICFTGTGRSLKYTAENLKKYLIDAHKDCDIFAHTTLSEYHQELQDFFSSVDTKVFLIEQDKEIPTDNLKWQANWPTGPHSGARPKQTYLNMLLSRNKLGLELKKHSKENNIKYDKIIFSRLDVKYYNDIDKNLDLKKISVPDFHNFDMVQGAGCNDRFAISSFENMMVYFSLFEKVNDYCQKGHRLHAESTLRYHLNLNSIKIEKKHIRFGRVRPNGKEIDLRLKTKTLERRDL